MKSAKNRAAKKWTVYIVRCANRALYTGITNDLNRRLKRHNAGEGGSYTRSFRPVALAWTKSAPSKSAALKLEARIKRLAPCDKQKVIDGTFDF